MNISVFGMGYVGCVTAACLAKTGHAVTGVEVQPEKVEILNSGAAPFIEPGLTELIREQVSLRRLTVTTDPIAAVHGSDLSLICVGTPGLSSGQLDVTAIENVCRQIGEALKEKAEVHTIVVRSTVLPGTIERCETTIQHASGKQRGRDFVIAFNPEFLREGSALEDFWRPPFTIVGARNRVDAERIAGLYSDVAAPVFLTDPGTAQMVKYASNLFHAMKVVFANEIGRISKAAGIDSHQVMEIFCHDAKLNLSAAYLRPGYAYGGSCLPKDLHAITAFARENHISIPVLERLHESNQQQVTLGLQEILNTGKQRIGVLGFSFKPHTDDLRESPHVALVEALIGKGKRVRIFDPYIRYSRLLGANRKFIDAAIPHVIDLLADDIDEVLDSCECIVVANRDPLYEPILDRIGEGQVVVDLVKIRATANRQGEYRGLSW
jgi:GDP-mannose 6-dehydrogenase